MRNFVSFLLVLISMSLSAQVMTNDSSQSTTNAPVDNTPYITNPAYNMWHNTNAALIQVASAADSVHSHLTKGVDASDCVWTFPSDYPTHTAWTKNTSGCIFHEVQIIDDTHIYALRITSGTSCPVNSGEFMWENTGTGGWNAWGTCLKYGSLSVSHDGMICGLSTDTVSKPLCMNGLFASGNTFQPISGVANGENGNNLAIAVHDKKALYLFGNSMIFCALSGNVAAMTCTRSTFTYLPGTRGMSAPAATSFTPLWAWSAYTTSGANVYYYSIDDGQWHEVYGLIANSISNTGGPFDNWATTSSGAAYRISLQGIQYTYTYISHTKCTDYQGVPNNCPAVTHTAHAVFSFQGTKHVGGGSVSLGAPPGTSNPLSVNDMVGDPFSCLERDSACVLDAGSGGWVDCPILGSPIFGLSATDGGGSGGGGGSTSDYLEACDSTFKNLTPNPPIEACPSRTFHLPAGPLTVHYCDYPVQTWCSNTARPDFNISLVNDIYLPPPQMFWGWTTPLTQLCFRFPWSFWPDGSKHWYHLPSVPGTSLIGQDDMIEIMSPITPPPCTYNP